MSKIFFHFRTIQNDYQYKNLQGNLQKEKQTEGLFYDFSNLLSAYVILEDIL